MPHLFSKIPKLLVNGIAWWCLLLIFGTGNNQLMGNVSEKPNFIILINHDHAGSALGANKGRFQQVNPTENIDILAENGCFFKNSFCSNGSAGPASATFLTGKFAHQHGLLVNDQKFDPSQATIPQVLNSHGYETALFGRWNLMTEPAEFSHWEVLEDPDTFFNPTLISSSGKRQIEGHTTDILGDLLIQWIKKQQNSKKPFLAVVFFNATQRPWMPTLRQLETYNDILLPEPITLFSDQKDLAPASRYQHNEIGKDLNLTNDLFLGLPEKPERQLPEIVESYQKNLSNMNEEQFSTWQLLWRAENEAYFRDIPVEEELLRWKYQRFAKNYLRCIRDVDENIGRIRSIYEKLVSRECIMVYTAHQGRFIGENGWFGTQWMMDSSMRTPLVFCSINGKTIPKKKIDLNVQDIDIAPTILSLASHKALENISGLPLNLSDWNSMSLIGRKELYFHHYEFPGSLMIAKHNGIRTNKFSLINYYQFGEWELFDRTSQLSESKNIADSYSEIEALRNRLSILANEIGDNVDKSIMPEKWRRIYRGPAARME